MKRALWLLVSALLAQGELLSQPLGVEEEIKQMQAIEPGFVPPNESSMQLYMLQKIIADNDQAIKNKSEEARKLRQIFSQQFRNDLNNYISKKLEALDKRYQKSIETLIKYYEEVLKNSDPSSDLAAEAMYFLGVFYFEIDEKTYSAKFEAYSKAKEQGQVSEYPEENFTRTINIYEKLIKTHPHFAHISDVRYLLALAFWYEGAFEQAVENFRVLNKSFPESRYVKEVSFRLGEYFFDREEYDKARDAYKSIVDDPRSPLYDKALYKLAWTYYQQNKFDDAIIYFVKLLELNNQETALMKPEAIKYIIKSFSEKLYAQGMRRMPKAKTGQKIKLRDREKEHAEREGIRLFNYIHNYFNKNQTQPEIAGEIYLEAASQLLDESKSEGAVLALQAAIALDPLSADAPRIESQIVDIWQDAHDLVAAKKASQVLIARYNKNSAWYASKADDIKARIIARDAVRDALLALAVYHHRLGKTYKEEKKEKLAQENFSQAAALYLEYIQEYPERDDTPKALFYYAESSYELERFKTALKAYELLKNYPLPIAGNFRRDAVYNIVFTFKHILEIEALEGRFKHVDFDALSPKMRGAAQEEIPELGKLYLNSIDEFMRIAPHDEQVPVLLFHAAAIYYVYGHIDTALSKFNYIIQNYPKSNAALVAGRLVINDAVAQQNWPRVIDLAQEFGELKLGGKDQDFARLKSNAEFKQALAVFDEANKLQEQHQNSLAKIKYQEATRKFEELLQKDPKSPYADIMLWNSARSMVQEGAAALALPLYRKLYSNYPKSTYAEPARFQEALALEKMLKFSEAARAYDEIIKQDPTSKAAADAMINKALLYEAAGEVPSAIAAFVAFAKRYPHHAEAPEALLHAAELYKKHDNLGSHIALLENFIKLYRKEATQRERVLRAHVQVAKAYGTLLKSAQSASVKQRYNKLMRENYRLALALFDQSLSPEAAFYAAKAQLALEKPELDAFLKMRISGASGKAQAEQLRAMTKKLAALGAKNEAIIRAFALPVSNAESLYRIGLLYEHLAKSMLKAPCPRDVQVVDEFACDEYLILLEDKANILEDKALDALTQAFDIAKSSYDAPAELLDSVSNALNRLRPGKYQRIGHVIEKPLKGAFYGQGRMLSSGKMASGLHEQELDPDIKKIEKDHE